ncbi:Hypothetical_protein [Hexamita inflata]|uniref:Hypothetical_protein n=1 Tax=Hexamita inflata TaxID=28002 RepID=A0AA86PX43_9EUKA|nr:Hypothetical protein HINF_LOCUS32978 [Hexamita inflata]
MKQNQQLIKQVKDDKLYISAHSSCFHSLQYRKKYDICIPKKNPHAAINEYLANTVRQTTQPNVQATIQKKSEKVKTKSKKPKKQKPKRKPDIPARPLIPQEVSAPHSTERREQVNFQINQNEILLSLPVTQKEIRMELTMQNNKTNTDFMQLIYCRDFAFKSK